MAGDRSMTTLVILPGMDGTGVFLEAFTAALGPDVVVTIARYPDDAQFGYAELEPIARAALPRDGPFFILGESFSGPLAVSLAAARPPGLKGVILCASFVRNPRPGLAWLKPFVPALPLARGPAAALSYLLLGKFASRALKTVLSEALTKISAATFRARLLAIIDMDMSAMLARLDVPILYLRATHDRLVPRKASEIVTRLNPRARVIEIDAPHFLLQSAPAQAARTVATFMRDTQDAGLVSSS